MSDDKNGYGVRALKIAAIGLMVLGVWLRVYRLGAESFWLDEVFSANIVEGPPGQILERIPPDKPPLDYDLQSLADRLPLDRETSHRLPAAIAGVVALFLIWRLARRLFGDEVAWGTLALVSAHALLIHYSREARPYMPAVAILTGQMWLFWVWRERLTILPTLSLAVVTLLGIYTLYGTALVLAAELLFLVGAPVVARGRFDWRGWGRPLVVFSALVACVFLAALPLRGRVDLMPPDDYFWKFKLRPILVARWIAEHLVGPAPVNAWAWCAAAPVGILVIVGVIRAWRRPRPALFISLCSIALPIAVVSAYARVDHEFWTRYTIYCIPGLCMLTAQGAVGVGERLRRPLAAPAIVLIVAVGMLALHGADRFEKPDWRGAARYLRERIRPGDQIVLTDYMSYIPLEYYMKREAFSAPLIVSAAGQQTPDATYWRVDMVFDYHERKAATVHGIEIEPLGQTPRPERIRQLAAALGSPPILRPGSAPAELLGAGWSQSEKWSKDFSVRWLTQTHSWFYLPLARPQTGRLTIKLMPLVWPQGPPQTIRPAIGKTVLERRALPAGFSTQSWDVPAGALASGYNRVELELGWVHSPSKDKAGYGDFRMLGAAVSEIGLTADGQ